MHRHFLGYAMLLVIIPHTKHASSRAIAVFAVFLFLPFRTILSYFRRNRLFALSAYTMSSAGFPNCLAFSAFDLCPT